MNTITHLVIITMVMMIMRESGECNNVRTPCTAGATSLSFHSDDLVMIMKMTIGATNHRQERLKIVMMVFPGPWWWCSWGWWWRWRWRWNPRFPPAAWSSPTQAGPALGGFCRLQQRRIEQLFSIAVTYPTTKTNNTALESTTRSTLSFTARLILKGLKSEKKH